MSGNSSAAVAAVAADDRDTADEALLLIDVIYEELTPVYDAEEAMADATVNARGDTDMRRRAASPPAPTPPFLRHLQYLSPPPPPSSSIASTNNYLGNSEITRVVRELPG